MLHRTLLILFSLAVIADRILCQFDDDDDDDTLNEDDFATLRRDRRSSPCEDPQTVTKEQYFLQLEIEKSNLKNRNHFIYTEVLFYKKGMVGWPTVLGWTIFGKIGEEEGKFMERKGLITEYKIKYVTNRGQWKWLKDPKTNEEVFKTGASLDSPDTKSEVTLSEPVTTLVARLYPQNWEGVPYMKIQAKYCEYKPPTFKPPNVETPAEESNDGNMSDLF